MIKTILALMFAINIDYGGGLFERMQSFEMLEKTNVTIPISGMCISACTMYLGLNKVCVEPNAMFGFHSAYHMNGDKPERSKFGNDIMMEYYPDNVKKWVKDNKALESLELTLMTAEAAVKIGIPKCKEENKK